MDKRNRKGAHVIEEVQEPKSNKHKNEEVKK